MRAWLLSSLIVGACAPEPAAPVAATNEPALARPETPEQQVLHWLAAHPEVVEIEALVLPDHHWMVRVDAATRSWRCVHATSPQPPTRACWSGRASEILADSFIPLAKHTDMRLLERIVGHDGTTVTRWLRFPGAVWSPAAILAEPREDDDDSDPRPSWYMQKHEPQPGLAQLPRPDASWRMIPLDGEPLDVTALATWEIAPVPTRAAGVAMIQLMRAHADDKVGFLCVRASEPWRCTDTWTYAADNHLSHELAYPLGDRLVVQRSQQLDGGASGSATLEFFAPDNLLLKRVGSLQIGAMVSTTLQNGGYTYTGDRRVQLWIHAHAPRGACIAIEAPEYEHVELANYVDRKRSLPTDSFSRTPAPDRLALVDGVFEDPSATPPTPPGPLVARTLTGLWRLDGEALVRVDPDPAAECPPAG